MNDLKFTQMLENCDYEWLSSKKGKPIAFYKRKLIEAQIRHTVT